MPDIYFKCIAVTNIRELARQHNTKIYLADLQFADADQKPYEVNKNTLVHVCDQTARILKYPENIAGADNFDDATWEYWQSICKQYPAPNCLVYNEKEFSDYFSKQE